MGRKTVLHFIETATTKIYIFWCFLALFMVTFGPVVTVCCSVFVVRRHETN